MEPKVLAQLLLMAFLAWIVFDMRKRGPLLRHLEHELRQRLPVFSAATVRGKEAELIRDRLPRKPTSARLLMLAGLLVVAALVWWGAR